MVVIFKESFNFFVIINNRNLDFIDEYIFILKSLYERIEEFFRVWFVNFRVVDKIYRS